MKKVKRKSYKRMYRAKNTRKKNTRKKNTRKKNTRKKNTRKKNTRKKNTRKKNTRKLKGGEHVTKEYAVKLFERLVTRAGAEGGGGSIGDELTLGTPGSAASVYRISLFGTGYAFKTTHMVSRGIYHYSHLLDTLKEICILKTMDKSDHVVNIHYSLYYGGYIGMVLDECLAFDTQGKDTMEYIGAEILTNKIRKQIVTGVCLGVSHLHSIGLVHGDIKPGNIVATKGVTGNYTGILIDLECAAKVGSTISPHVSPAYQSPQFNELVARKLQITRSMDIWSLGITIIEIYNGELGKGNLLVLPFMTYIDYKKYIAYKLNGNDEMLASSKVNMHALRQGLIRKRDEAAVEDSVEDSAAAKESMVALILGVEAPNEELREELEGLNPSQLRKRAVAAGEVEYQKKIEDSVTKNFVELDEVVKAFKSNVDDDVILEITKQCLQVEPNNRIQATGILQKLQYKKESDYTKIVNSTKHKHNTDTLDKFMNLYEHADNMKWKYPYNKTVQLSNDDFELPLDDEDIFFDSMNNLESMLVDTPRKTVATESRGPGCCGS